MRLNASSVLVVRVHRCAVEATVSISGVIHFVLKGVLFPSSFFVCLFVDAVEFFRITRQCSFDASLPFIAYRRFAEIGWEDVRGVGWFTYEGKTDDVLSTRITEIQVTGNK